MANRGSEPEMEEKSWCLFATLLRIGHPVDFHHLASRCQFFTAAPELVLHAASLPDSPLSVAADGIVKPSAAAVFALGRFFSFQNQNPSRKRKLSLTSDEGGCDRKRLTIWNGVRETSFESFTDTAKAMLGRNFPAINFKSRVIHGGNSLIPLRIDTNGVCSGCPVPSFEHREVGNDASTRMLGGEISGSVIKTSDSLFMTRGDLTCQKLPGIVRFVGCKNFFVNLSQTSFQDSSLCDVGDIGFGNKMDYLNTCKHEYPEQNITHPVGDADICGNDTCKDPVRESNENEKVESDLKKGLIGSGTDKEKENVAQMVNPALFREDLTEVLEPKSGVHLLDLDKNETGLIGSGTDKEMENIAQMANPALCGEELTKGLETKSRVHVLNLDKNETGLIGSGTDKEMENVAQMANPALCGEELTKGLETKGRVHVLNLDKKETIRNTVARSMNKRVKSSNPIVLLISSDNAPENVDQSKNDKKFITRNKSEKRCAENMDEPETSMISKVEKKAYPSFESFTIEEEEGSGGYGIVYRARRITDGKRLAIKCPHNNAPKHHVNNERNMLERFGGKNFIIKLEDSFKSGSSDCFVLEHVDHDRPEVLKREIDIIQLQWYGYCMFRALAFLHKEGVVHRDVKPGNFLFSRKLNKGYLIDFNLAADLKQKYNVGSKSKPGLDASNKIPLASGSALVVQDKNLGGSKSLTSKRDWADYKKYSELNRHVKQKVHAGPLKTCLDKAGGSLLTAQGTDGSGVTSAKDVTSTKTVSAETLRENLPYRLQGRKELATLLQNSMQCASSSSVKGPSSQRKRVIAPSGKMDSKNVYITPMPLHSTDPAAILRSKGDVKHKREGSCVGTKGFRAPEVLLRSQFQGTKADIWSAGVTLLYLVIGKTPFTGEPEQNLKEIAKLRGSEELWEVAKLHDRESSFPAELLDHRHLQSWDMESWCKYNTKRPEFHERLPKSLFDLIDKCLTVNPRSRISVDEVLRHEFFASCNEAMMKQRMIRRGLDSKSAATRTVSNQFLKV